MIRRSMRGVATLKEQLWRIDWGADWPCCRKARRCLKKGYALLAKQHGSGYISFSSEPFYYDLCYQINLLFHRIFCHFKFYKIKNVVMVLIKSLLLFVSPTSPFHLAMLTVLQGRSSGYCNSITWAKSFGERINDWSAWSSEWELSDHGLCRTQNHWESCWKVSDDTSMISRGSIHVSLRSSKSYIIGKKRGDEFESDFLHIYGLKVFLMHSLRWVTPRHLNGCLKTFCNMSITTLILTTWWPLLISNMRSKAQSMGLVLKTPGEFFFSFFDPKHFS